MLGESSLFQEGVKDDLITKLLEFYEQKEAAREDKASEEDTISSPFSDDAGEPEVAGLAAHKDTTTAVLAKMLELQMSEARKRDRAAAERQTALMELIGRTSETKEERETKVKEEKKLIKRKQEQYVLEKRDRKRATLCQQMQKLEDSIDMEIFLQTFKEAMIDGEYEETEWLKVLKKYLAEA